jgi:two-component system, NtrC family, sensor kinase
LKRRFAAYFELPNDTVSLLEHTWVMPEVEFPTTIFGVHRRKDGSTYPAEIQLNWIHIDGQRMIMAMVRDITQRKLAEEALRESEQRLRAIYDGSYDAIMLLTEQGFCDCNPRTLEMFGFETKEEFTTTHPADLSPPTQPNGEASFSAAQERIQTAFRQGANRFEWVHRRKNGEDFPAEILLSAFDFSGKKVLQATVRDITERKRLEIELRQSQKMESIGQLAAGIAHEINTPAQFVSDNLTFLEKGCGDILSVMEKCTKLQQSVAGQSPAECLLQEIEEFVQKVDLDYCEREIPKAISESLEGIASISKIVKAMKAFAHPGSVGKVPLDLNKAIGDTITISRNEWKYVADLETNLDPALAPVPCIEGEISQAVLNIIVNAAQAIAPIVEKDEKMRGVIHISTCQEGDWAVIRIRDTGTGIPKEIQNRIFDPFFTTKKVGQGSGQGLAIAYSVVVEKHKGSISCDSDLGKGATFTVRLPLNG